MITVVIVDACSSGSLYPEAIRKFTGEAGCRLISLRSSPQFPSTFGTYYRREDFDVEIIHDDDLDKTLQALRAFSPEVVLAGSEPGVDLAETLSRTLGLRSITASADAACLRNKAKMYLALQMANVPYGKFINARSEAEIAAFQSELGGRAWPIILKPARSSGTVDVFICKNPAELQTAFAKIYQRSTEYHEINDAVVVQEYLDGQEYSVNLVSCDGVHRLTDILAYARTERPGAATVYDYDLLLSYDSQETATLTAYAVQVLDALKIKNGPSHLEIKLTTQGPRLVDFGARMCGARVPRMVHKAVGASQIDWTLQAYLAPQEFIQRREGYKIERHLAVVFLSTNGGCRLSLQALPVLRSIPGVEEVIFNFMEGDLLLPTTNSDTVVGQVVIFAPTAAELMLSVQLVQAMREWRAFEIPVHHCLDRADHIHINAPTESHNV